MNDSHPLIQENFKSFTSEFVQLLINNNLLEYLVKKELTNYTIKDIEIDKNIIDNTKKNIYKQQNFSNDEEFKNWLSESDIDENTFFRDMINSIKYKNYIISNYGHMSESLFLKKQDDLDLATYSLIRVNDHGLAQELYMRINESEERFEDIALNYSIGPEKASKGLVGPVAVSKGHPIIAGLIRSSEIGKLHKPKNIDGMFVIFRLEAIQKSKLDEQMKLNLSQEIFESKLEEETKVLVDYIKLKYQCK